MAQCKVLKEGGVGREEKKETEERKGKEGVPSYDTSVQGHTKRKEGFPAMTKASRDTQTRRRERKGRRKEREREAKERKRTGVPSYAQASRDTPVRGRGEPDYYIQEHPKMTKRGERRGGEEEGG